MFYNNAEQYVETEKEICIEEMRDYGAITVSVSGNKLLEVFANGGEDKISETSI